MNVGNPHQMACTKKTYFETQIKDRMALARHNTLDQDFLSRVRFTDESVVNDLLTRVLSMICCLLEWQLIEIQSG